MCDGRRPGVTRGEIRCLALRIGARQRLPAGKPAALENRVIGIPGLLLPRTELHFGERAVRIIGPDQARQWIVAEDRRHTRFDQIALVLIRRSIAKERFVFLDRIALVIDDRAAGADPTRLSEVGYRIVILVT